MTATAVLESATDVSLAANAELLIRAMQNVALFACKDDTLPALCALHFTGADGELRIEATDRYALAQERLPCEAGELDILVDAKQAVAAAKALTAALKPTRRFYPAEAASVGITIEGSYARFTLTGHMGPEVSAIAELISGEYIRGTDKRFPDEAELSEGCTGRITFNTGLLARVLKVTADKNIYPKFTLGAPGKIAVVHIGEAFRVLMTTIREAA